VTITVRDASQLKATEYELRADPDNPASWQLLHVPDDGTAPVTVVDGQQVDGFIVHFNAGPVAGDRFLMQPVSRAASGMQRLLTDPLDLAAASPFVASTPSTNNGTVAVNALRMVATPTDIQGEVTVTFTGADPSNPARFLYDWELRDAGGTVIGGATGLTWTPGQPIPSPPDTATELNGFQLDITGVPQAGDRIEAEVTQYPATNNGNALSLNRLGTLDLVGLTELSSGELSGGLSFNESFVAALADVGVRAQGAEAASAISSGTLADAGRGSLVPTRPASTSTRKRPG
jgi:flagellar hook-associated protein 1 FlgK